MNSLILPLLTLALSLASALCWAEDPKAVGAKAITGEPAANWNDLRTLDFAWRQQRQADLNLARNELVRKAWITEGDSFASTIARCVPNEYQYALMLELTRRNAKVNASTEFLKIAPEGFAELFDKRDDRAALVTLFSRRCPETIRGIPVDVWIALRHFECRHIDVASLAELKNLENLVKKPDASKGLYNGILVLCDAFDQSADAATREVISRALRHAFKPYLMEVTDESHIAKACREWFDAHRSEFHVIVGPWYPGSDRLSDPATAVLFRPLSPHGK